MCIISKQECDKIQKGHLIYLKDLSGNAQDMVFGALKGKLDIHQKRLGAKRLQPVVNALKVMISNIKASQFKDFEGVYDLVQRDFVSAGCWKNPRLLTYDIALRLAYYLDPVGLSLMPQRYLYLHAAPYRSAKMIARKLGDNRRTINGRVDADYLDKIFDCEHCDQVQKEHVLCLKHELIEELYGK